MNKTWDGTLIGEIKLIAEKGEFCKADELPAPEKGEEVIGECTNLEKAVFTLFDNKAAEIQTIGESLAAEDNPLAKIKRAKMLKSQIDTIMAIFWQLVHDRLDRHNINLGIRQGLQLVELSDEAAVRLARPEPGIRIIEIGGSGLGRLLGLD